MDKQAIYKRILDIANQLKEENATYTRADLAYDLQQLGVAKDGVEVGMLVWDAYTHFHNSMVIKNAFYNNDNKQTLVDECQVDHLVETGNADALFPLLQNKLNDGMHSLENLEKSISRGVGGDIARSGTNMLNTLVGAQGVVNVKNEATTVFNGYSTLVGNYDDAKTQIKFLIEDFVKLRSYVCDIYRQYAMVLVDAFGDSVKTVSPELFDFDSIEWLDVQGMLQSVKLDYDRITEKCSLLMSDITESFSQSVKTASASYRSAGNKQVGLLLAGLNMVSHYVGAGEKTMQLKQELQLLKNSVKHDTTLIKGDLGRLLVIYKSLNDLYIPQSETFCRFSKQVLSTEWQQLNDELYADPAIRKLKEERDGLLSEYKETEKEMTDAEMNVAYYSSHIAECKQLLDSMRPQYDQARSSKPGKPFFLVNWLTFGSAGKRYNRDIYEWNMACKPVISRYEDLQVDIKLDSDELQLHQTSQKENRHRHQELQQQLNRQNKLIMERIRVNPSVRLKMLPHLEAVVGLLRMGRSIAESKLDSKLTKAVTIQCRDTTVSEETRQNISRFAQLIREQVGAFTDVAIEDLSAESQQRDIQKTADATDIGHEDTRQTTPQKVSAEDVKGVVGAGNEAVQQAVNLLETWGQLQAMQAKSALAAQEYDRELEKLQNEFRQNLASIDDKAAVLRESMRRIHTAGNYEQLKEGMLSLAGKDKTVISEQEWEDFLNGNRTIEL